MSKKRQQKRRGVPVPPIDGGRGGIKVARPQARPLSDTAKVVVNEELTPLLNAKKAIEAVILRVTKRIAVADGIKVDAGWQLSLATGEWVKGK